MKPQYTNKISRFYETNKNFNVLSHIAWLNQPEELIMKVHIDQPLDYLRQKIQAEEINQQIPQKTFFLQDIKNNEVYTHLFAHLTKLFMDFEFLLLRKCEITDKMLQKVDPEFWSKKVLTLIESRAESIIKGIYSKNVLNRLRGIVIGCDTLGNKGVKILMSIEMNNLKNILFANIQCTTDVVKTLKKKERPQYWYHDVLYQQKFDHLIYYKQCLHFRGDKDTIFEIEVRSFQAKTKSIYFGHLSKLFIKEQKKTLKITIMGNLQKFKEQELQSETVLKNMEQLINWKMIN